jgi:hypothetical protein
MKGAIAGVAERGLAVDAPAAVSLQCAATAVQFARRNAGSALMKMLGLLFRTLFILVLVVLTVRVAHPQMETIWSLHETPSDLLRVALGLGVVIWLAVNIFQVPKDPGVFRTWLYLGPVLIPLAVLCTAVIW